MRETAYALLLILGGIGLTLLITKGDRFDRSYKTYQWTQSNTP